MGKTTTINMFADMLFTRGWRRESRVFHGNGVDITDVYVGADGVRLGEVSTGDNFREFDTSLRILFDANCTVVVCACRTRDIPDANGVVQGTFNADTWTPAWAGASIGIGPSVGASIGPTYKQ
jgi:hypothetical protein